MSFAVKLQELRQEHGISQEGLAEMLNVSRQSVSKWERGKGYPEIEKLIHISERFGISLDELLKETTTKSIKYSDSVKERRPISLSKPEDRHEEIQEIYPNPVSFNHKTASQPADLTQYGNYSAKPQSQPSLRRRRRRLTKKQRLIFAMVCIFIFFISFIINFVLSLNISRYNGSLSPVVTEYSTYYEMDDEFHQYNLKYMTDESTGTRYIFNEDDNYGIIISSFDITSESIKLRNISNGNISYCERFYYDESAVVCPENGHVYVIPYYMLSTLVSPDEQYLFELCEDINTKQNYFVPLYITEQCEEAINGKNDDETEYTSVAAQDEEAPEYAENDEFPEVSEN